MNEYNEQDTTLLLAAKNGEIETVREALASGANINAQYNLEHIMQMDFLWLYYQYRRLNDRPAMVDLDALERGNDIMDNFSEDGMTALMLAILHGHTSIVTVLLDHGPDLDIHNIDNKTAMDVVEQQPSMKPMLDEYYDKINSGPVLK